MFKFTFSISKNSTMVYYPTKNTTVHVNHLNREEPSFAIFSFAENSFDEEMLEMEDIENG